MLTMRKCENGGFSKKRRENGTIQNWRKYGVGSGRFW
jgi:hypothetical protein